MSRRKLGSQRPWGFLIRRRVQVVIAFGIGLSLLAAWTMLASSGAIDSIFPQKGKKGRTVSTASFNSNSPSKEYIYAGGRLVAAEEPSSGGGCGPGPGMPGQLNATAISTVVVSLTWPASSGAVNYYQVERKQTVSDSGYQVVNPSVPPANPVSVSDSVSVNTAYVYRVRAFDAAGCPSQYSNIDLATTVIFTSDPPVAIGTTIYAVHLTRLLTAVNAVRTTAGLSPFDWTDPSLPVTVAPAIGGTVLKDQVQKLRNRLNEARGPLNLGLQPYTNEPLTAGTIVLASHILELRVGVQ